MYNVLMELNWAEILTGLLTASIVGLIGFVWRFSHKVTSIEREISENKRRIRRIESDHDKVMDKMYSLVKDRSSFLTRESYRGDSQEIKDAIKELNKK